MSSTHQTRPVDPVTDPDARATAPRTQPPGKGRPLSAAARVAGLVGLVTVVACLLVTALGWPAVTSAPHDLPIGVAAPPRPPGRSPRDSRRHAWALSR